MGESGNISNLRVAYVDVSAKKEFEKSHHGFQKAGELGDKVIYLETGKLKDAKVKQIFRENIGWITDASKLVGSEEIQITSKLQAHVSISEAAINKAIANVKNKAFEQAMRESDDITPEQVAANIKRSLQRPAGEIRADVNLINSLLNQLSEAGFEIDTSKPGFLDAAVQLGCFTEELSSLDLFLIEAQNEEIDPDLLREVLTEGDKSVGKILAGAKKKSGFFGRFKSPSKEKIQMYQNLRNAYRSLQQGNLIGKEAQADFLDNCRDLDFLSELSEQVRGHLKSTLGEGVLSSGTHEASSSSSSSVHVQSGGSSSSAKGKSSPAVSDERYEKLTNPRQRLKPLNEALRLMDEVDADLAKLGEWQDSSKYRRGRKKKISDYSNKVTEGDQKIQDLLGRLDEKYEGIEYSKLSSAKQSTLRRVIRREIRDTQKQERLAEDWGNVTDQLNAENERNIPPFPAGERLSIGQRRYVAKAAFGLLYGHKNVSEELCRKFPTGGGSVLAPGALNDQLAPGGRTIENMRLMEHIVTDQLTNALQETPVDDTFVRHLEGLKGDISRSYKINVQLAAIFQEDPYTGEPVFNPAEREVLLKNLHQSMKQQMKGLQPGQSLIIGTGSQGHATLMVFTKMDDGKIKPTFYNTGAGLDHMNSSLLRQLRMDLTDKASTSESYPSLSIDNLELDWFQQSMQLKGEQDSMGKVILLNREKFNGGEAGTAGKATQFQHSGTCSFMVFNSFINDRFSNARRSGKQSLQNKFKLGLTQQFMDQTGVVMKQTKTVHDAYRRRGNRFDTDHVVNSGLNGVLADSLRTVRW